ncbi:hypothetical protein T10_11348 [Trichinella papuae]|uniref:Uncharacterized protein n=1 Tax=Trichinella papuae TaxID=268474 RepID=A0A0V1M9W5_9BILA|nr:hypothetical protein T10_11348 [Trichinella papuae]
MYVLTHVQRDEIEILQNFSQQWINCKFWNKKAGNRLIDGERRQHRPDASKGKLFRFWRCLINVSQAAELNRKLKMMNEFSLFVTHKA